MNKQVLPLVSIITPSYNQAAFIEQTIQSVLQQTYKHIEFIIIDGGSTDGSQRIIEKYKPYLTYTISEPDSGQTHAINKGLKESSGQLFAYLNSDDLYDKDAVSTVVSAYLKNPEYAMYYGKCTNIDEHGNTLGPSQGSTISYFKLLTGTMLPSIHQPSCFFNRSRINRFPVFDESLKYGMDYDLILWIMERERIHFINHPLSYFRYHNQSKTVSQASKMYEEKMRIQRNHNKWLMPLWMYRWLKHRILSL